MITAASKTSPVHVNLCKIATFVNGALTFMGTKSIIRAIGRDGHLKIFTLLFGQKWPKYFILGLHLPIFMPASKSLRPTPLKPQEFVFY
jgi:hypothetical protein